MFLGKHCGGCGNGNQSCKIARCSLEQGTIEYCYQCEKYPCEQYEGIDAFDSFITHRHQKVDLEKAQRIGIDEYNREQNEKIKILHYLLSNYNDGRKKAFFCVAVNLLGLSQLQEGIKQVEENPEISILSVKEKSAYVADVFRRIADRESIQLRLNKKK